MLKKTTLDHFCATPFPPLQTLGDVPSFTGAPMPALLQDEPGGFANAEPESLTTYICREIETIKEWDFVARDIHAG